MAFQAKMDKFFGLNYEEGDDDIWIKKGKTLRRLIGILGMSLPILLVLITIIATCLETPLESISHYYYTIAGSVFTVILSLIAVFLIVYNGKKSTDFYVSTLAGIFALCVVFFPTDNLVEIGCNYNIVDIPKNCYRENFHIISAGIFISLLAYMSLFVFTKSDKPNLLRSKEKRIRNWVYKICGILIIISLLIIVAGFKGIINEEIYQGYFLTFWMETLAIESFGFAWLVKGETLFKDK